jgi:hypothetical protein
MSSAAVVAPPVAAAPLLFAAPVAASRGCCTLSTSKEVIDTVQFLFCHSNGNFQSTELNRGPPELVQHCRL